MNELLPATPSAECAREWQTRSMSALVVHISGVYHEHTRDELPLLIGQAQIVASKVAPEAATRIQQLVYLLAELLDQVDTHAWTEDDLLFPVLVAREHPAVLSTRLTPDELMRLLESLAEEHVHIRRVLASITAHLQHNSKTAAGNVMWTELLSQVARLHDRLIDELNLEDRCLFPRARQIAQGDRATFGYR